MIDIKTLPDPVLSPTALTVLTKRYLKRDENGNVIETPKELFYRVASFIATADAGVYDVDEVMLQFYKQMVGLKFLPNTPTLINAGNALGQLSACFFMTVPDSMEGIFTTLKNSALIFKSGGGVGYSFSKLRPSGDTVSSTIGVSSGPVSFAKAYNACIETIKQGGVRRGAAMGLLRVDHPDILTFIKCKDNSKELNNFNISIAVTDEFMKAVKRDKEYDLINPRTKEKVGKLKAKDVFDLIVQQAWKNGEPGILFLDTVNKQNPVPSMELEGTNPCGELPLENFGSCNLGSVNLAKFVHKKKIDWEGLKETVAIGTHFLDNVIDLNKYPLPEIEQVTKSNRKIGLGVMGWAEMLVQLGITYGAKESLELAEKVMKFIQTEALKESQKLAKDKGPFPNFSISVFAKEKTPRRNATLTTIAPTGTISMLASASSGIEPLFGVAYTKKNVLDGKEFQEINPYFEQALKDLGLYSDKLIKEVIKRGSIQELDLPKELKKVFVIAHDITPEEHINMQAAFQLHVCNSISKTVNFPSKATKEQVAEVYLMAYSLGCKGVTVYRDGSREGQILNIGEESKYIKIRKRPRTTKGETIKTKVGCGTMYVTVNEDHVGPCEVFTTVGKSGGCTASQVEAVSRIISLALRAGINPDDIIDQLKGIRCPVQGLSEDGNVLSCGDGLAKTIERYLKDKNKYIESKDKEKEVGGHCPECPQCGTLLLFREGCVNCPGCGYARCG